ncbi:MAG: response regulator transcription factor [Kiritimatiellia bacterium]|jgi:DNA-binding NarL/FixJ family response regulator|nr:response regulator transcription factor [Kiritimatiellia bacterium]MDP6631527.1 response regulator transcription factor [Kiritimatiellia bacterium]MDP6810587.1 response regulator transcription factor [Kiritimatiellia bacterium]MDP7022826.1 response regulator transcription factor [Kiritimatiellia bacterium]
MAKSSTAHILLVDDHPVVRKGLAAVIDEQPDLKVCAQAGSCDEAMTELKANHIDVALVDLRLEEGSGLNLIGKMCSEHPDVAALVFSMHDDKQFAERAIRAGAKGYVMKQEPTATLLEAIRSVRDGDIYVRPDLAPQIMGRIITDSGTTRLSELDCLSDREIEVLQLMAEGMNRREIAAEMGLSVKTIESYRENMKKKLVLRDTVQLAQYAVRAMRASNV